MNEKLYFTVMGLIVIITAFRLNIGAWDGFSIQQGGVVVDIVAHPVRSFFIKYRKFEFFEVEAQRDSSPTISSLTRDTEAGDHSLLQGKAGHEFAFIGVGECLEG